MLTLLTRGFLFDDELLEDAPIHRDAKESSQLNVSTDYSNNKVTSTQSANRLAEYETLNKMGLERLKYECYSDALDLFKSCCLLLQSSANDGASHPADRMRRFESYQNLACTLLCLNQYYTAISVWEKALEWLNTIEENDDEIQYHKNNIHSPDFFRGLIYFEMGIIHILMYDHATAGMSCCHEAIKIMMKEKEILSTKVPHLSLLTMLGIARYAISEQNPVDDTVEKKIKSLGITDISVVSTMSEKCKGDKKRKLAQMINMDMMIMYALNNIGCIYSKIGKLEVSHLTFIEAKGFAEKVVKKLQKSVHKLILRNASSSSVSSIEKKITILQRSRSIVMANMALVYVQRQKNVDAINLLGEAILPLEPVFGVDHPYIWPLFALLAKLYSKLARYDEAELVLGNIYKKFNKNLDNAKLSQITRQLCHVNIQSLKYQKALVFLDKLLLVEKHLEPPCDDRSNLQKLKKNLEKVTGYGKSFSSTSDSESVSKLKDDIISSSSVLVEGIDFELTDLINIGPLHFSSVFNYRIVSQKGLPDVKLLPIDLFFGNKDLPDSPQDQMEDESTLDASMETAQFHNKQPYAEPVEVCRKDFQSLHPQSIAVRSLNSISNVFCYPEQREVFSVGNLQLMSQGTPESEKEKSHDGESFMDFVNDYRNHGPIDVDDGVCYDERGPYDFYLSVYEKFDLSSILSFLVDLFASDEIDYGNDHKFIADDLFMLSLVCINEGDFEEASEHASRLVHWAKSVNDSSLLATSFEILAMSLICAELFEEAQKIFQEAYAVREKNIESLLLSTTKNSPPKVTAEFVRISQLLCHLACISFEFEDEKLAISHFDDALNILRNEMNRKPDEVALNTIFLKISSVQCNMGLIHMKGGKYNEARVEFEEALLIQKKIFPLSHRAIVSTLENLSFVNIKLGFFNEALDIYNQLFDLLMKTFEDDHMHCLTLVKRMNFIYIRKGDFKNAVKNLKMLLSNQEHLPNYDQDKIDKTREEIEDLQQKYEVELNWV